MQEVVTNQAISALTTAANDIATQIGSVIGTIAPVVRGVAITVTVFFAGWKIVKRITGRI